MVMKICRRDVEKSCKFCMNPAICVHTILTVSLSTCLETEPLSHTENGLPNDESKKDPAPNTRPPHTTSDYRAAKKERTYYPGHTNTPPPLRRVSSNPTELGQVCPPRRVEGRFKYTHRHTDLIVEILSNNYEIVSFTFENIVKFAS